MAVSLLPLTAQADPIDPHAVTAWLEMATASQAAQPRWMTPLITVTPRLEQEFRYDFYSQQNGKAPNGNGQHLYSSGGPGGYRMEIIPTYDTELIIAAPPTISAWGPGGKAQGPGDTPIFLAKYRFISANEQSGNYIVSGFFQMSSPSGVPANISNNLLIAQPTLAFGKGWGDFDVQSTVSAQFPVQSIGPKPAAGTTIGNFGDPILWNTAFQYHFFQYFWPELEVNYTYFPNGVRAHLNQVLLTPGLILGRFNMAPRQNLIFGVGYQFAVTPNPQIQNNLVATIRYTF